MDRLFRPTQGRLNGAVTGPNLEAFGLTLGLPGLAAQAFELRPTRASSLVSCAFANSNLASAGDRLAVSGILGTHAALAGSDLSFDLAMQDASDLAALLGKPVQVPGPIRLQGRLASAADGQASLQARRSTSPACSPWTARWACCSGPLQPDLRVDFHSTDPRPLAPLLGDTALPARRRPCAAGSRSRTPCCGSTRSKWSWPIIAPHHRAGWRPPSRSPAARWRFWSKAERPAAGSAVRRRRPAGSAPPAGGHGDAPPEQPVLIEGIELDLAGHRVREMAG